eukprot:10058542-Karenia_brevis.AAC.1
MKRLPCIAANVRVQLIAATVPSQSPNPTAIASLHEAALLLQSEGCGLPTWEEAFRGLEAPQFDDDNSDHGDWQRGWQRHASAAREKHESDP